MPSLATFAELHSQNHTLGLYCIECDRWGEADLGELVSSGLGDRALTTARFRCRDCGQLVDKQVRPPVPTISGAVAYIGA